jgi:signal transduction histidine kinase
MMGIKIDGQQILKSLEGLKTMLSEDTETLKQQDQHSQQETERMMSIIDEISNTFQATNNVGMGN